MLCDVHEDPIHLMHGNFHLLFCSKCLGSTPISDSVHKAMEFWDDGVILNQDTHEKLSKNVKVINFIKNRIKRLKSFWMILRKGIRRFPFAKDLNREIVLLSRFCDEFDKDVYNSVVQYEEPKEIKHVTKVVKISRVPCDLG